MITQLTWHGTWCSNQINENATNQAKQSQYPYHISVPLKGLIKGDKRCVLRACVCNKVLMTTAITIISSYPIVSTHRLAINCHLIFFIKWQDYYLPLRCQTRSLELSTRRSKSRGVEEMKMTWHKPPNTDIQVEKLVTCQNTSTMAMIQWWWHIVNNAIGR